MDNIIEEEFDVIELPSKGLFYKSKKNTVQVSYLTATDENILTSPNLLQSGKVIDVLLNKKIVDKDIKADDMLPGDKNAILFWLRSTGYGEKYPIEVTDPNTNEKFEYEVDLSEIPIKEITLTPDENGECEFILPLSKSKVKFRYLTSKEEDTIVEQDEKDRRKKGPNAISEVLTKKLIAQIMEIDGIRDRNEIYVKVNRLKVGDSSALRKYINDNEPGLDTNIQVTSPSGSFFFTELPITTKFLWPYINS